MHESLFTFGQKVLLKVTGNIQFIQKYWEVLEIFNNESGLAEPGAGFRPGCEMQPIMIFKSIEKYWKYLIMNRLWRAEGCPDTENVEIHV